MDIAILGDLAAPYALISTNGRAIGMILPDVVVEEVHNDELAITQHPVEMGAPVSDHAFKMPATVEMRVGWSDSKHGAPGCVKVIYQALLSLQEARQPFAVSTGKRRYTNMLISAIRVTTDERSETALNAVVILTKVIISKTQTTSASGAGAAADQAKPQQTSPVQDLGLTPIAPQPSGLPIFTHLPVGSNPYGKLPGAPY